jgi:hypothetical protein
VLLLKLMCHFELGLVDFGVECADISRTFLQGDGSAGYEVRTTLHMWVAVGGRWLWLCQKGVWGELL